MNLWNQFLKYQRDLVYVGNDQALRRVCVGLSGTFYFWGGATPSVQQAIANCFDAFEARFGAQLARHSPEGVGHRAQPARAAALREHLAMLDADERLEWHVSGGRSTREASDCYMAVRTAHAWQTCAGEPFLSWLNFAVPVAAVYGPQGQPELFMDLLRQCCSQLHPWQGSAGLASLLPQDGAQAFTDEFDLQQRYYGLDIVSAGHALNGHLQRALKGVNWLTFFDRRFPWPHSEVLPPALRRHTAITHWSHGPTRVIQAGTEPVLAPVRDGVPLLYQAVSEAIRSVRLPTLPSFHVNAPAGDICFDRRTSNLWVRRFDEAGIWPPYPGQLQFPEQDPAPIAEEPRQHDPAVRRGREAPESPHRTFTVIHRACGEPLAFHPYRLEASDGQVFEGVTDARGVARNIGLPRAIPVNAMLFLPRNRLGITHVAYLSESLEPSDEG